MSSNIQISPQPAPEFTAQPRGFEFADTLDLGVVIKDSMALQANKLAEHEGKIAGLTSLMSALQSYKGFLQAAILTLLSFVLAGLGLLVTLQIRADNKTEAVSGKFTPLETRISAVEDKVDALPGRISRELRETSRDLVLITRTSNENQASGGETKKR